MRNSGSLWKVFFLQRNDCGVLMSGVKTESYCRVEIIENPCKSHGGGGAVSHLQDTNFRDGNVAEKGLTNQSLGVTHLYHTPIGK